MGPQCLPALAIAFVIVSIVLLGLRADRRQITQYLQSYSATGIRVSRAVPLDRSATYNVTYTLDGVRRRNRCKFGGIGLFGPIEIYWRDRL